MTRKPHRVVAKIDANQPELVDNARKIGALVWPIGYPVDLLILYCGTFELWEVKMPGEDLRLSQRALAIAIKRHGGNLVVVRTKQDVVDRLVQIAAGKSHRRK